MMTENGKRVWESFTPKEKQLIVVFVNSCGTTRELSLHFGTSDQMIKNRFRILFDKTGMSSRFELLKFALVNGLYSE